MRNRDDLVKQSTARTCQDSAEAGRSEEVVYGVRRHFVAVGAEAADGGDIGRDNKLAEKIAAIRGRRERHKALLDELVRVGED